MEKRNKSILQNRRHMGSMYNTTSRTHPSKMLLTREPGEWQRSKIKATTSNSGDNFLRATTSEEPFEDQYICSNIAPIGTQEAHV
ncbi:hypothetical protein WUBG_08343 [Wuchereria bancrofti]|uniref:Uncharacterized protein n=2 Tax=Wuchereria bancrofti TaxID=6293 RepID=J9F049_WUCBA|nr:hypothetical protein WUBG_08343 [Wuchereria bancrofti]VDM22324.1 unnamed protein product [Wuchereria bancrofti]